MSWFVVLLLAVLVLGPAGSALQAARAGRRGGLRDRAGAVTGVVEALLLTVLGRQLVPWDSVPPLLRALPVAATAFTALASALAWRALPTAAGTRPRLRLAGQATSAVVALVVLGAILLA